VSARRQDTQGVVIAGAGLAGQRCAETLRRSGYDGRIRIVGDEPARPYDRPPLSKGVLAGNAHSGGLSFRPASWYEDHQVELLLGRRLTALDPAQRRLRTADGEELLYDDLLVATGSAPRMLPEAAAFDNVHLLRTVADAERLREALRPRARLAVIGAGFIGQEVAATARSMGVDVTIVEAAGAPLEALIGSGLGGWFADLHREEGVRMLMSTTVSAFRGNGSVEELELSDGRRVECDVVVIGIGVAPATGWLEGSGLPAGGVPLGAGGRTALPHVYAAGDAALSFDERLGTHVRSEHWESAAHSGAEAARGMLCMEPRAHVLPSFWSDQYGLRIQYVGRAAGADEIELDGSPGDRDFAAVFRHDGMPVAALLVGRPQELPEMRRLVATRQATRQVLRR
jgi:NADPH-dependent 2,4-dienoyl-CoA reductase/sulfur reductase-like enzyme